MDTNKEIEPLIGQILGSARGSRAGFGSLAETIFYFTTKHTKLMEIL
jgi:hypothetical protein